MILFLITTLSITQGFPSIFTTIALDLVITTGEDTIAGIAGTTVLMAMEVIAPTAIIFIQTIITDMEVTILMATVVMVMPIARLPTIIHITLQIRAMAPQIVMSIMDQGEEAQVQRLIHLPAKGQ